jgi:hypothetical protein
VSWGKIAVGVGGAVLAGIGIAIGKVWGNAEGEKDRRKMSEENEDLRRQIRAVLDTFKGEMVKKDEEIEWLEGVIDQLIKSPPANAKQLGQRLHLLDLTDSQIELVEARMAPIYGD